MTELAHGPEAPVNVCQLEAEFVPLLDIYRIAKPKKVLEIGTAEGGTLYHWLMNAQPGAHIVSLDLENPDYDRDLDLIMGWRPDNVSLTLLAGDSHEATTQKLVGVFAPFDWVFIDGSHTYEAVAADLQAYVPMTAPGAHVVLHDISLQREYEDGAAGVDQAWRQLQANGFWTLELRACSNAYGIGVVRLP